MPAPGQPTKNTIGEPWNASQRHMGYRPRHTIFSKKSVKSVKNLAAGEAVYSLILAYIAYFSGEQAATIFNLLKW